MYLEHFQAFFISQVFFFTSSGGQFSCVGVLPLDHAGVGDVVSLQIVSENLCCGLAARGPLITLIEDKTQQQLGGIR